MAPMTRAQRREYHAKHRRLHKKPIRPVNASGEQKAICSTRLIHSLRPPKRFEKPKPITPRIHFVGGVDMKVVRIVAVPRDSGHTYDDYTIVLLCGLDDNGYIVNGEWYGCVRNEAETLPFVLQRGERFFYGGEDQNFTHTNIGTRPIGTGSYFAVFGSATEDEEEEYIYQIKSCHAF